MEDDRNYVAKDAMLLKTQDTVATNHTLRLQYTSLASMGLIDPQCTVQPTRKVGNAVQPQDEQFAQTGELWVNHHAKQMRLAEVFEGAAQDAMTNNWAILKMTLSLDYWKDPIGNPRFGTSRTTLPRSRRSTPR